MLLQFISKDDCHLCDAALPVVERVCRSENIPLEVIKIQSGDEWWEKYWDKIPVVIIDGEMIFKYRVDEKEFLQKLHSRKKLLDQREFMEDIGDTLLIEQRKSEPSRPLEAIISRPRKRSGK